MRFIWTKSQPTDGALGVEQWATKIGGVHLIVTGTRHGGFTASVLFNGRLDREDEFLIPRAPTPDEVMHRAAAATVEAFEAFTRELRASFDEDLGPVDQSPADAAAEDDVEDFTPAHVAAGVPSFGTGSP